MVLGRIYVGLLGVLAVALSLVSLAWACAPQGAVVADPASGVSAATVTVTVSGFPAGEAVDVRWSTISGPLLASGVGPGFTRTITVPSVDAGIYVITAATTDEHAGHTLARAPFEVTAPAPVWTPPAPVSEPVAAVAPPADAVEAPIVVSMNPFAPTPAAGGKVITGTDGPDHLVGTPGRDVIRCLGGNDVVQALGGDDVIDCGSGADRVDGGAGDDVIRGGAGDDVLVGGAGDDDIFGAAGNDKLAGGSGADRLYGGVGLDVLRGNAGRDRLTGGAGRDMVYADRTDRVVRGPGDHILR